MKVRALPTCRKPVGEGAKRTLGCGPKSCFLIELTESGMRGSIVRAGRKQRQAAAGKGVGRGNNYFFNTPVLKTYCVPRTRCETIISSFSGKSAVVNRMLSRYCAP